MLPVELRMNKMQIMLDHAISIMVQKRMAARKGK
jgi:hypothetical protein